MRCFNAASQIEEEGSPKIAGFGKIAKSVFLFHHPENRSRNPRRKELTVQPGALVSSVTICGYPSFPCGVIAVVERSMWIWSPELKQVGFRRLSYNYWKCLGRFGLQSHQYFSAFLTPTDPRRKVDLMLLQFSEFHVTLPIDGYRIHFYYHESSDNCWYMGGHSSSRLIRRLGHDPGELREAAFAATSQLLKALNGQWRESMDAC